MIELLKNIRSIIYRELIWSDDDEALERWYKENIVQNRCKKQGAILLDCTHLGFRRWNIEHLVLLNALRAKENYSVIGLRPARYLIWPSLVHTCFLVLKRLFNKDKKTAKILFNVNSFVDFRAVRSGERYRFASKADLIALECNGVRIGDLVYDTYLKWYRKAEVNLDDPRLTYLVANAVSIADQAAEQIEKNNIKLVLLTHSVYIFYGVIARISINKGCEVYITQNTRGRQIHKLDTEHPYQTPRYKNYKKYFSVAENDPALLDKAKADIECRYAGDITPAINYMRKSAYVGDGHALSLRSTGVNVIIMLHCFFDSPHIYNGMLFHDFVDWINHTIGKCLKLGYFVYVKPHPNGLPGNQAIIDSLRSRYPTVTFLDKNVSNKAILNSGFDCAFTVYGTVGSEFPYFGLPVINAGDNPHSSFEFCVTPKSISEFDQAIADIQTGLPSIDQNEILKFFVVNEQLEIEGKNIDLDRTLVSQFSNKENYSTILANIDGTVFENLVQKTSKILDDN